jgi:hypothetical protein
MNVLLVADGKDLHHDTLHRLLGIGVADRSRTT